MKKAIFIVRIILNENISEAEIDQFNEARGKLMSVSGVHSIEHVVTVYEPTPKEKKS